MSLPQSPIPAFSADCHRRESGGDVPLHGLPAAAAAAAAEGVLLPLQPRVGGVQRAAPGHDAAARRPAPRYAR